MVIYRVLSLCLIIFGILIMRNPIIVWKIRDAWATQDGTEPSDLYMLIARIVGGVFIFVGLVGLIALFFFIIASSRDISVTTFISLSVKVRG